MLRVSYKMKGLTLNELWFASDIKLSKRLITTGLYCYRQASIDKEIRGLKKEKRYTLINDLTEDKDKIFSNFESSLRNQIRKFEKIAELTCSADYDSRELFLDTYKDFANAKKLPIIKKESIDKYGKNLFYIKGYIGGELTNMQVYILDKDSSTIRLLHSISTIHEEKDKHQRAKIGWINRYLHWKTMLDFKELGFKIFDWGGYTNDPNSPLVGIDKFKASFGGKKVVRYNYYTLPYYALKIIQERVLS